MHNCCCRILESGPQCLLGEQTSPDCLERSMVRSLGPKRRYDWDAVSGQHLIWIERRFGKMDRPLLSLRARANIDTVSFGTCCEYFRLRTRLVYPRISFRRASSGS